MQANNHGIVADTLRDCILSPRKFNLKSCFSHITFCRFRGKQFSGIERFARRCITVSREDIVSAIIKCNKAIGSHKSLKCSIEISLGAVYHISKFENTRRQLCRICSFPETITHIYNHLLTNCSLSKYLWPFAYMLIMRTTRRRISITSNLIFFNKLKPEEVKVLTKIDSRDIFSIMAIFRLTLWQIYYSTAFLTRNEILNKLNKKYYCFEKMCDF